MLAAQQFRMGIPVLFAQSRLDVRLDTSFEMLLELWCA
jgi:hypothetical protein